MDELVRYGPWLLSLIALLLAWSASVSASGARARLAALERELGPARASGASDAAPSPGPSVDARAASPAPPLRGPVLEERLGALEARLAELSAAVAFASRPDPDDVAPMRPPVPTTVEPVAAPRSGWRMFP